MPGTTSLGLRYPLPSETVTAQSYQDLAEDIDSVLDTIDLLETKARVPQMAMVTLFGSTVSVPQAVHTLITFDIENIDNASIANLGVNNDRLTLSAGIWFVNGYALASGGTTVTAVQLQFYVNTVLHSFNRIDDSSAFTTKNITAQSVVKAPVNGTILQMYAFWSGTGGPATWSSPTLRVYRIREL